MNRIFICATAVSAAVGLSFAAVEGALRLYRPDFIYLGTLLLVALMIVLPVVSIMFHAAEKRVVAALFALELAAGWLMWLVLANLLDGRPAIENDDWMPLALCWLTSVLAVVAAKTYSPVRYDVLSGLSACPECGAAPGSISSSHHTT